MYDEGRNRMVGSVTGTERRSKKQSSSIDCVWSILSWDFTRTFVKRKRSIKGKENMRGWREEGQTYGVDQVHMCKLQQEVEKGKQHNLAIYGLLVRILSKAGKMKEHAIDVSTQRDYKQQLPRKNHQGHRTTGTNVHKHPINLPVVTIVRISGTWQGRSSLISYMDAIGCTWHSCSTTMR